MIYAIVKLLKANKTTHSCGLTDKKGLNRMIFNIVLVLGVISLLIIFSIWITKDICKSFDNIPFTTQEIMTRDNSNSQKQVTYKEFIDLFKSKSWYIEDKYKGSFFSHEEFYQNSFHAGIWKVNDIGLLPKDYTEYKKIDTFLNTLWDCMYELGEWKEE
jgi:hypothetical protein